MKHNFLLPIASAVALLCPPAHASIPASTITLDFNAGFMGQSYVNSGYQIVPDFGGVFSSDQYLYPNADPDGATLLNSVSYAETKLSRADGSTFWLGSMALADGLDNVGGIYPFSQVRLTFEWEDHSTISVDLTLDSLPGLQTVDIANDNLLSVSWKPLNNSGRIQIDDIFLSAVPQESINSVPEPNPAGLLGAGILLLGAIRSRAKGR